MLLPMAIQFQNSEVTSGERHFTLPRNAVHTKQADRSFPAGLSMSDHRSDQVLRQDLLLLSEECDQSTY